MMKKAKYLLAAVLALLLAMAGCESDPTVLVVGEYMGITYRFPESWESKEDSASLEFQDTYGNAEETKFEMRVTLHDFAEQAVLEGETSWDGTVGDKLLDFLKQKNQELLRGYKAVSTEKFQIDGHPALVHCYESTLSTGQHLNYQWYLTGVGRQYVSFWVRYYDGPQDVSDNIKADVKGFIESINLSNMEEVAAATPEPTPEPTPETQEWKEAEYQGMKFSVPAHWTAKEEEDELRFSCDYDCKTSVVWQSSELDGGVTWGPKAMPVLRPAFIEGVAENEGYKALSTDDLYIDGHDGFVHRCLMTFFRTKVEASIYVTGKGSKCYSFAFGIETTADQAIKEQFDSDVAEVMNSVIFSEDITQVEGTAETGEDLGSPLTLLKVEAEGEETTYTATAPEEFSDDEYSEIPSHISMHDFLEKYPILGVTVQIEPAKIHFLSLSEESRYTFFFEEASLRTKSKGPMTKDKMKEIAASALPAESEETQWVEQECDGVSFLLPDCLAESEGGVSGRNVFAGRLSGGAVASVFLVVTDMSGNGLDWENEIDRYLIQEKMLETASKKEGYQAVATEEMQFGSYPGYMHRYTEMDYDDKYESTMYCFLVDDLFVIFASTIDDNAGTDKEELNEIMSRVISSVNVSGLE